MIHLIIDKIKDFNIYVLKEENGTRTYEIMFEFYGDIKPEIGDKILIDSELLNRYSAYFVQPYAYEVYEGEDLTKKQDFDTKNYSVLYTKDKTIILKRLFG